MPMSRAVLIIVPIGVVSFQLGCRSNASRASPSSSAHATSSRAAAPPTTAAQPGPASPAIFGAAALPPGRSPEPTPAEWSAVREVTVQGSSALGCETKMVREWLRVSCRGKNDTGGTPTTIAITKGAGIDRYTFAAAGLTSLLVPFVDGTDVEATFSWTDKSHRLVGALAPRRPEAHHRRRLRRGALAAGCAGVHGVHGRSRRLRGAQAGSPVLPEPAVS